MGTKPTREEQSNAKRLTMTLEDLEGSVWPKPSHETGLIRAVQRVRKIPLGQLTVEDLRVAIGQRVGLEFLVPIALDVLDRDPLSEGDFFPGDLLLAVARSLDQPFWRAKGPLLQRLRSIVSRALGLIPTASTSPSFAEELSEATRPLVQR